VLVIALKDYFDKKSREYIAMKNLTDKINVLLKQAYGSEEG
jgi:hypothetical protein